MEDRRRRVRGLLELVERVQLYQALVFEPEQVLPVDEEWEHRELLVDPRPARPSPSTALARSAPAPSRPPRPEWP